MEASKLLHEWRQELEHELRLAIIDRGGIVRFKAGAMLVKMIDPVSEPGSILEVRCYEVTDEHDDIYSYEKLSLDSLVILRYTVESIPVTN
jgi:hypothetical protein